ncbi:hypothetical protein [Rhizobium sp. NFR07]|uniref:hypothetical protein n=1 Tax=Rhizobium sp. NFR07 TaxID=1566262 RepID=UPI0015A6CCC1|nr:hypothetical protein [Rhizobium sp. NFR07]
MDIKSFVSETLTQILEGVREAQKRPGGQDIAADGYSIGAPDGQLMDGGTSGIFTTVGFDISVIAEAKEGGSSVRVADTHVMDGASKTAQNASRVKFSVHVRLPEGGQSRDGRGTRSSHSGSSLADYNPLDY